MTRRGRKWTAALADEAVSVVTVPPAACDDDRAGAVSGAAGPTVHSGTTIGEVVARGVTEAGD